MHISIGEIFGKSWVLTKQHFGFLVLLSLALGVLQIFAGDGKEVMSFLLNLLVGTLIILAWTRISLDIVDGKNPTIDAIGGEMKNFFNYLVAYLIFQVALVLGVVLFVVPGIYVAVTYGWFSYFIGDKNQGIIDSLKQSGSLVEGVRWQIVWFLLAAVGLNMLGALALLVGLFVTIPMTMIASALVYRTLLARMATYTPIPPATVDTTPPAPSA